MKTSGQHVIADVWLNEYEVGAADMAEICRTAIGDSNATILGMIKHDFSRTAFTALWLLGESHFSIHTFPERNYMSMDCYTCGGITSPMKIISSIILQLDVKGADIRQISRGDNA